MLRLPLVGISFLLCIASTANSSRADAQLRDNAIAAMKKAAAFYHGKAASHGGYVYFYSEDLSRRWGEGEAAATTIFVQPPVMACWPMRQNWWTPLRPPITA